MKTRLLMPMAVLATLALPLAAQAQGTVRGAEEGAAVGGRAALSGVISDAICGRDSGPLRYDIVQRVWKTSGAFSCTLLSRKTRLPSAEISFSS